MGLIIAAYFAVCLFIIWPLFIGASVSEKSEVTVGTMILFFFFAICPFLNLFMLIGAIPAILNNAECLKKRVF